MRKVATVNRAAQTVISNNPGLPSLTGCQIENWALSRYRGFSFPYYIVQTVGGIPSWVENPKATTVGTRAG